MTTGLKASKRMEQTAPPAGVVIWNIDMKSILSRFMITRRKKIDLLNARTWRRNAARFTQNLWLLLSLLSFAACQTASTVAGNQPMAPIRAARFPQNPIISKQLTGRVDDNINGPSLIRIPEWVTNPLGRYYLYFAHHKGDTIRLAYANDLAGPWQIYQPGVLALSQTICTDHLASPDLHVDQAKQEIRMYFHCPLEAADKQVSLLAHSTDGIHFTAAEEILGDSYFRVFEWQGYTYAMARLGVLYRSKDGASNFELGPNPFQSHLSTAQVRHVALQLNGNLLSVFYSRIGDNPESILLSTIELTPDWRDWQASAPMLVLKPENVYEGSTLPAKPSVEGMAREPVHQLRDPAIFREAGKVYLLYSVAGESGIAIAELEELP